MDKDVVIKNLSFGYGKNLVLQDINLEILKNEYIAIIGPNGGGKTTLLKLLLGFLKPTFGVIKVNRKVGYLAQHINFNTDMPINILEIVLQGRLSKNKFFYTKKDKKIALEKLEFMNISHLKNRKIKDLSGGERQRVLLARALTKEPDILILDEPTASIDIKGQQEIYKLLSKLQLTKIVVSHDINILFEGVDRVAYINKTLYLHDNIKSDKKLTDGHICEMELLDYFRNHKCMN